MKKILLENFRCFDAQEIEFKRGLNLLIGDNASGKTTILKACKYVLSSFFAGFSDENTKWICLNVDDFAIKENDGIILPEEPIKIHFTCYEDMYESIVYEDSEICYNPANNEEEYILQKNSKKNSRALVTGLVNYRDYCNLLENSYYLNDDDITYQKYALPLFACFTTEDIHSSRKINSRIFKKYAQKPTFGYYDCLEGNGLYTYWLGRLLALKEGNKNTEEIEIVSNAITKALYEGCSVVSSIDVRPIQGKVYYIFSDGREVEAELLSDGYRRIVNIVTDLAFRCAILNRGIFGNNACEKTCGTVLIDEIDLHLHPSLQVKVLNALHATFPKLQFVATTHAPMVMTGIENNSENVVYKLKYSSSTGYSLELIQTYGMDASSITRNVLDLIPRDNYVNTRLEQLFNDIDNSRFDDARIKLKALYDKFGSTLPELSKAETMLNLLNSDYEENH